MQKIPVPIPIGDKLYLFRRSPSSYADTLVISAHGAISKKFSSTFINRSGAKLHFYSKHGSPTIDKGLTRTFVHEEYKSQLAETVAENQFCYDYLLMKYQGRHGNLQYSPFSRSEDFNETYESILQTLNVAIETEDLLNLLEKSDGLQKKFGVSARMPVKFDVLTVRFRFPRIAVSLSSVLRQIQQQHQYKEIHCYFCREFIENIVRDTFRGSA